MSTKMRHTVSLILLVIFNALDAIFTIKYIKYGPLEEGNMLLAPLVEYHCHVFLFSKIFFVTLFAIFLWSQKERKIASFCLNMLTLFYAALMFFWTFVILSI
jgi:hypothetical protein